MIFKLNLFLILPFLFFVSCKQSHECSSAKNLLKKVDTTGEYYLKYTYCFEKMKDTSLAGDSGVIRYTAYSRMYGKLLDDASLVVFRNTYMTLKRSKYGSKDVTLPVGQYDMSASSVGLPPAFIKNVRIEKNRIVCVNIYIGSARRY